MNCTCIEDTRKRLTECMATSQGVVNPRLEAQFVALLLEGGGTTAISLQYIVRGDNRPYNTQKGQTVSVFATYCPFCGKPTKKEPA